MDGSVGVGAQLPYPLIKNDAHTKLLSIRHRRCLGVTAISGLRIIDGTETKAFTHCILVHLKDRLDFDNSAKRFYVEDITVPDFDTMRRALEAPHPCFETLVQRVISCEPIFTLTVLFDMGDDTILQDHVAVLDRVFADPKDGHSKSSRD